MTGLPIAISNPSAGGGTRRNVTNSNQMLGVLLREGMILAVEAVRNLALMAARRNLFLTAPKPLVRGFWTWPLLHLLDKRYTIDFV